ncbi:hypothetical protein F4561_003107 [Lipingzhangella halophila]|uniref:Uncharacterized protein n=1 Tax=Lipingzhangella halophila TaxID=1783352 RepID=A0A7W7RI32_9ACTN|nr:hypothetical protein [Lipingzhangella halophila]MBB4932287.1 hypothetical protein [Lipingzhangella halophila]
MSTGRPDKHAASENTSAAQRKRGPTPKVAAMRKEQARRERRRRAVLVGAIAVTAVVLIGLAGWGVTELAGGEEAEAALPEPVSGESTAMPPWPLPEDPVPLAEQAGLRVEPMEGTAKHFHAHLDIIVDGEPVTVPANLGIHPAGTAMSELHTHDERGVLHVEAPTDDQRYNLGQVFAQWDVRLDETTLGGLEAEGENALRAYVDGELHEGNPAAIELTEHRQIALVYGPEGDDADVPADFDFEPGE